MEKKMEFKEEISRPAIKIIVFLLKIALLIKIKFNYYLQN